MADIKIPAGYRITDAKGARKFLEAIRNPVPSGLVGMITPDSGNWWATLETSETGYVKDEGQALDSQAILAAVSAKVLGKTPQPGSSVDWELKPAYDTDSHSLEWATRSDGPSDRENVVRHVVRLLGRHGVVQMVSVQSRAGFTEITPLKQLTKGISFKAGEAYADFQKGDRLAQAGFGELIAAGSVVETAEAVDAEGGGVKAFWIGLSVVGCAVLVVGVLLVRKLNRASSSETKDLPAATATATTAAPAHGPVFRAPRAAGTNGAKIKFKANGTAPSGNSNHPNSRRRRVFNYPKFYTEMMLQGPTPVIGAEPQYQEPLPEHNHSTNGNGSVRLKPESKDMLSAHAELINSQKTLIEEQKRLIQEQARFIEEKSKLIAEKNQLLERQSQMIDNNLL